MPEIPPRHIGIDFDNTIVSYDDLFLQCAFKKKLVNHGHGADKNSIRDAIRRRVGGEDQWQKLQATVYGNCMAKAKVMEGFEGFIRKCRLNNNRVTIISHKTEFAAQDQTVNLRKAAFDWMAGHDFFSPGGLGFQIDDIFFEATREEKIERVRASGCTHFIDDLIEVLIDEKFPVSVQRFLFFHFPTTTQSEVLTRLRDWRHAQGYFFTPID